MLRRDGDRAPPVPAAIREFWHALRRQFTADTARPPTDTSEYPLGPWDEAGPSSSMGYLAMKGPALIQAVALGEKKTVLALLARAVTSMP